MGKVKAKGAKRAATADGGRFTEIPRLIPLDVLMGHAGRNWKWMDGIRYRVMEDDAGVECVHVWDEDKKQMVPDGRRLPDGWSASDLTHDLDHWGITGQLVGPKEIIGKLDDLLGSIRDLETVVDDLIYGRWHG